MAACWYGGARGVGRTLLAAAAERDVGPHALAHLGAVDIALHTARSALDAAAAEIDADPATGETAAACAPCGCARWSRPWPPRSCTGWAARSERAR